ncbi:MAG: hypothetical protein ACU0CA_10445 [Paracoccaceae bacterium]
MKTSKVTTAAFLAGVTTLAVSLPSFASNNDVGLGLDMSWGVTEIERISPFSLDAELDADGVPVTLD